MMILYLEDYKRDEEAALGELGVGCVRMNPEHAAMTEFLSSLPRESSYIPRGPRLSAEKYELLWRQAHGAGLKLTTSPQSYRIGSSFEEQYAALGEHSPAAVILSGDADVDRVLQALLDSKIRFPVFVRSEIESAAKYVGVAGCVISRPDRALVAQTVENLRRHVQGFSTLILKEVVELAKDQRSGESLEYRAIGLGGKLLTFDFEEHGRLPSPQDIGLTEFASQALTALAAAGADGGLFVDVALSASRTPIVVECKNLLHGSISALHSFASALKTLR